jgi:hypothetical protein
MVYDVGVVAHGVVLPGLGRTCGQAVRKIVWWRVERYDGGKVVCRRT